MSEALPLVSSLPAEALKPPPICSSQAISASSHRNADTGSPNRVVQTVIGLLVLNQMFHLTYAEALEQLEG